MKNPTGRNIEPPWAAFDDLPDAIAVLDGDLRCLYANRAAGKMLGTSRNEMLGKTPREIGRWPPKSRLRWHRLCRNVLATGRQAHCTAQCSETRPVKHYRMRVLARRDENGRIAGLLNIAIDISEDRRAEQALSHGLRTPLNAILGWTQALKDGADRQTLVRALAQIEKSAKAQARLIDKLLNGAGPGVAPASMRLGEPVHVPAPSTRARGIGNRSTASARHDSLAGLRILAVDDDRNTREMLVEALGRAGAEVHAAASAREALDQLQRYRPDVLLSDIGMPEQDGCELLHRVRVLPPERGGATPAIAITGYAAADDCAATLAAGYQAVATKPVNLHDLVRTIREATARRLVLSPAAG